MKKLFLILVPIFFAGIVLCIPFLVKVQIDCKSQYTVCPQPILDILTSFNGKKLAVAKKGIAKNLKSNYMVSDYSLQFKFPNRLHVEILTKKAIAAVRNSRTKEMVLVNSQGDVVSKAGETALPVVTTNELLPLVGQKVGETDLFAVNLAKGIFQMYQIRDSFIEEESLVVELPGQIRVLFPLAGDSQVLLGSLRLIYSKIQEDGNLAGYTQIDLRFANPILK